MSGFRLRWMVYQMVFGGVQVELQMGMGIPIFLLQATLVIVRRVTSSILYVEEKKIVDGMEQLSDPRQHHQNIRC